MKLIEILSSIICGGVVLVVVLAAIGCVVAWRCEGNK